MVKLLGEPSAQSFTFGLAFFLFLTSHTLLFFLLPSRENHPLSPTVSYSLPAPTFSLSRSHCSYLPTLRLFSSFYFSPTLPLLSPASVTRGDDQPTRSDAGGVQDRVSHTLQAWGPHVALHRHLQSHFQVRASHGLRSVRVPRQQQRWVAAVRSSYCTRWVDWSIVLCFLKGGVNTYFLGVLELYIHVYGWLHMMSWGELLLFLRLDIQGK